MLEKETKISREELDNLLELVDFAVESKRKEFWYHKKHYEEAIKSAIDQLKTQGWMDIRQATKILKIFPEDLIEELQKRGYRTFGNIVWNSQKIVELLKTNKVISEDYIEMPVPRQQIIETLQKMAVKSEREGIWIQKQYLQNTLEKIEKQIAESGEADLEEVAKTTKIPIEDLAKQIVEKGYGVVGVKAISKQKTIETIFRILRRRGIVSIEQIKQEIVAKPETVKEILEKIACKSVRENYYYDKQHLEQLVEKIKIKLDTEPWLTKQQIAEMGILPEDIEQMLQQIAEKSPTNPQIYYKKGKIKGAKQKIDELVYLRKIDKIAEKLGMTIQDTKLMLGQKGYYIENNTVILPREKALERLKRLARDAKVDKRWGPAIGIGLAFRGVGKKELETLKYLTKDRDWVVRYGAALGIGLAFQGTGDRDVLKILEPLTRDRDWFVRNGAALGIGLAFQGMGERGLEILESLIRSKDWHVKSMAALGIGLAFQGMGERGLEILESLIRSKDWHVKSMAALGIGLAFQGMGERGILKVFESLIRSKDWHVRRRAALGIGLAFQGTGEGILGVLKPLTKDERWDVRRGAALGIGLAFQGTGERGLRVLRSLTWDIDQDVKWGAALGIGLALQERHDGVILGVLYFGILGVWLWDLFIVFI